VNYTKLVNTHCGQNAELLIIKQVVHIVTIGVCGISCYFYGKELFLDNFFCVLSYLGADLVAGQDHVRQVGKFIFWFLIKFKKKK
jgi:hypothetical protein